MLHKTDFHSKLVGNAHSQARQPLRKGTKVYRDQAALLEEKQKRIQQRIENLRRKHAKVLAFKEK